MILEMLELKNMHSLGLLTGFSSHFPDFVVHRRDTFLPSVIARIGSFLDKSTNNVDSSLIQSFVKILDLVWMSARQPVDITALEQLRLVKEVDHQTSGKAGG